MQVSNSQLNLYKDNHEYLNNQIEQLENIRKETIEYLEYQLSQMDFEKDTKAKMLGAMTIVLLNKGSEG